MQSAIHQLKTLLSVSMPASIIEVDAPDQPEGNWWIDVRFGRKRLTLEYRAQKGFGIFDNKAGYGEGPAEVYRTPERAARRVSQLLTSKRAKRPRLTLKDLRELYACSQENLAQKVGVKQSAISRFERRAEVKLGTLAAAVKALGGKLEVRAHFSDSDVPISVNDE